VKVITIVGTRPEFIKLSRVIACLDEVTNHVLVHTGQNYDPNLSRVFFDELGIRAPDHFLEVAAGNVAETIANVIVRSDAVLELEQPDAVLVLGDTNSTLAVMSAKRRHIPIFHMEAGNRCFDQRVPEEINRKIVDHLSDINLPYTEHARRYLLAEGISPDQVIKTGSPQKEVLDYHSSAIDSSHILDRLNLTPDRYFTASVHREENVDDLGHLEAIVRAVNTLAADYDFPLVLSTHPRTRARLCDAGFELDHRIMDLAPLGLADYIALEKHAFCTISDSGTITEEASLVGFPAITIREAHERPEGMDEGVIVMSGLDTEHVLESVSLAHRQYESVGAPPIPDDYAVSNVSWKVAKIILSYTPYVNRRVWYRR
jgi:UDP-N-acetylglucosamine 2-epimerase